MLRALFLSTATLLLATPAYAVDTYMWGVGPKIGTVILPGHLPIAFPNIVDRHETIEKVRDDISFGVETVYYVNGHTRALASADLVLGKSYLSERVLLKYNYVTQTGAMDFLFGGGAGVGRSRFKGQGDERLVSPFYPFRAEGSALIRDGSRGYQLTLFSQLDLPANQSYTYADGSETRAHGGFYLTFGAEIAVFFGDFTPPRRTPIAGG